MAYGADTRLAIVSRREESLALAVMDALLDAKYVEHAGLVKAERSMARALEVIHSSDLENISAAALCVHGFWHMGQFAADYRAIYGELPSKTLRRN